MSVHAVERPEPQPVNQGIRGAAPAGLALQELQKKLEALLADFKRQVQLRPGQILVVGCSSSEVWGDRIGQASSAETGAAIHAVLRDFCQREGLVLAAQCCEHLNRALVMERREALARGYEEVNVRPWLKGGGAFATAAYEGAQEPCCVASISADYGLDIGETLIGMHLRPVIVPLRLLDRQLLGARVTACRRRPPCIGGERARYVSELA